MINPHISQKINFKISEPQQPSQFKETDSDESKLEVQKPRNITVKNPNQTNLFSNMRQQKLSTRIVPLVKPLETVSLDYIGGIIKVKKFLVQDQIKNSLLHRVFMLFNQNEVLASYISTILLDNGVDPNHLNQNKWSALHLAVQQNQYGAVKFAVKHNLIKFPKFDFDQLGGTTKLNVLHIATQKGNLKMVILLQNLNINVLQESHLGRRPRNRLFSSVAMNKLLIKMEIRQTKQILKILPNNKKSISENVSDDDHIVKPKIPRLMNLNTHSNNKNLINDSSDGERTIAWERQQGSWTPREQTISEKIFLLPQFLTKLNQKQQNSKIISSQSSNIIYKEVKQCNLKTLEYKIQAEVWCRENELYKPMLNMMKTPLRQFQRFKQTQFRISSAYQSSLSSSLALGNSTMLH